MPLSAQTTWSGTTGSWFTPGNWSSNSVPNGSSTVYVTNGGTPQVGSTGAAAQQLVIAATGSGSGLLVSSSGALTTQYAYLGAGSATSGNATVNGTWTSSSFIDVGYYGGGTLTVSSGGKVITSELAIGDLGTGKATITGAGSTVTTSWLYVGWVGAGTLTVSNQAQLNTSATTYLGASYIASDTRVASSGTGSITISDAGTTWNADTIYVGTWGTGTVTITNGATVTASTLTIGDGTANHTYSGAVSNGTVTVSGLNSSLNITGGDTVYIGTHTTTAISTISGRYGTGALIISDGAAMNAGTSDIVAGKDSSTTGSITVTGSYSPTTRSKLITTGDIYVGNSGTGTMSVASGGVVNSANGIIAANSTSTGSVTLTNTASWVMTGDLTVGGDGVGSLVVSGASAITSSNTTIGDTGTGTMSLDNSTLTTGALVVGNSGVATLSAANGSVITASSTVVASASGSVGSVSLDHSNMTTGTLNVGTTGSGSFSVANGSIATTAAVIVGDASGSNGSISVSTSTVSTTGTLTIGNAAGSTGTASITGTGAIWTVSSNILVGESGTGTLNVSSGGALRSTGGTIGDLAGSSGTATVNGGTWTMSGNLIVGNTSTGSLLISGGGHVVNVNGTIGSTATGSGSVVATGSGTTWTLSGPLVIGSAGTGSLTIADNAVVSPTGVVTLASGATGTGTLNIGADASSAAAGAGVLNAATVTTGAGTGTVQFNHTSTGFHFTNTGLNGGTAVAITGTTQVVQTNGYTVFDTNYGYTGTTTVNGGTLELNGNITASNVTVNGGNLILDNGKTITNGLTVNSGGKFTVGLGTPASVTVGTLVLNSGSTTNMHVLSNASYDVVNVTTATLGGALALYYDESYVPTIGDTFTVVTATTLNGGYSSFTNTQTKYLIFTSGAQVGNNYDVTVDYAHYSFLPYAGSPAQQSVAQAVNAEVTTYALTGSTKMQPLIAYLDNLAGSDGISALTNASALNDAFNRLSPEQLTAMSGGSLANTRATFNMLSNRFGEVRSGQRFSDAGLVMWDPSREFSRNSLIASNGPLPIGLNTANPSILEDPKIGMFVSGQGTYGDVDGDNKDDGYNFTTGGILLGGDYRITDHTVVGGYIGYQNTDTDLANSGNVKTDSAKFGVYASYWWDNGAWINGSMGGGLHSYSSKRAALGDFASGDTNGTEFNVQMQEGYDFTMGRWTFGPTIDLTYTRLNVDSYTESGSVAPLAIQSQTADSLQGTIGMRVSTSIDVNNRKWKVQPYANAGLRHEFMDTKQTVNASFANGSGSVISADSPELDSNSFVGGFGLRLQLSERLFGSLGYQAELNSDYTIQSIMGSVTYRF